MRDLESVCVCGGSWSVCGKAGVGLFLNIAALLWLQGTLMLPQTSESEALILGTGLQRSQ